MQLQAVQWQERSPRLDGETTLVIHPALEKRLLCRPMAMATATDRLERLLVVLALVAVILYAAVLPLWEGWDEPFHYGYIESLAVAHRFPILNRSTLTSEISQSLILTPLSRFIAEPTIGGISIEQHHALSPAEKRDMRERLEDISPATRQEKGSNQNYEAQQAPLAYMALVPFDVVLTRTHLVERIFWLRLIEGVAGILLCYGAFRRLLLLFAIRRPFRHALLFCAFSSQLLWASVAHVGNDWLAIPFTLWFLVLLAGNAPVIALGLMLTAGLLTKAYFFSFVPVFVAFVIWRWMRGAAGTKEAGLALLIPVLFAGPWYARNELLYGSLSGTQETVAGISIKNAITAIPHIHWWTSILSFFRNSLWTGNWSFTAYSRVTLTTEELLIAGGLIAYLFARHRSSARRRRSSEGWVWAAMLSFVTALFYQTCVTWVHTHGQAVFPEPWYWQGVVLFVWAMVFRGLSQRGIRARELFGRGWAILLCLTSAWIAASTFAVKLIPEYGGGITRATIGSVLNWWASHPAEDLRTITLASPAIVFGFLTVYLALLVWLTGVVVLRLIRNTETLEAPALPIEALPERVCPPPVATSR